MAMKNNNGTSSPTQLFIASYMIFLIVAVGSVGKIDAETICSAGKVIQGYCKPMGSFACRSHCIMNHYSPKYSQCFDDDCVCMTCPGEGASKTIVTEKLKLKRSCTIDEIIDGVCFPSEAASMTIAAV